MKKKKKSTKRETKEKDNDKPNINIDSGDNLIHDDYNFDLSSNEPIRELFTPKNVKFKTQVTEEQRGAISILLSVYFRCKNLGIDFSGLKNVLDEFIDFGVSLDRKSRGEFVESQKSQMQNLANKNNTPNDLENIKV